MNYFVILSMVAVIIGLLGWLFILLWRNDELANEVNRLTMKLEFKK